MMRKNACLRFRFIFFFLVKNPVTAWVALYRFCFFNQSAFSLVDVCTFSRRKNCLLTYVRSQTTLLSTASKSCGSVYTIMLCFLCSVFHLRNTDKKFSSERFFYFSTNQRLFLLFPRNVAHEYTYNLKRVPDFLFLTLFLFFCSQYGVRFVNKQCQRVVILSSEWLLDFRVFLFFRCYQIEWIGFRNRHSVRSKTKRVGDSKRKTPSRIIWEEVPSDFLQQLLSFLLSFIFFVGGSIFVYKNTDKNLDCKFIRRKSKSSSSRFIFSNKVNRWKNEQSDSGNPRTPKILWTRL